MHFQLIALVAILSASVNMVSASPLWGPKPHLNSEGVKVSPKSWGLSRGEIAPKLSSGEFISHITRANSQEVNYGLYTLKGNQYTKTTPESKLAVGEHFLAATPTAAGKTVRFAADSFDAMGNKLNTLYLKAEHNENGDIKFTDMNKWEKAGFITHKFLSKNKGTVTAVGTAALGAAALGIANLVNSKDESKEDLSTFNEKDQSAANDALALDPSAASTANVDVSQLLS